MSTPNSDKQRDGRPVVVKKYANRRLYNTATSSYVTLEDLARMIKEGGDFVACDAKTGEDITRSVLTQIIVEQEQKGKNLLPISFLRQIISCFPLLAQLSYGFAHSHCQCRYSLDPFQSAVWKLSVFSAGDFREEKFCVPQDTG